MAYGAFAQVYDRLMWDMPYSDWVRFANDCWEQYGRPKVVVDLGCGTGAIAIPLAESGLQVYGIDLSVEMLAIAREKNGEGAEASVAMWLQQDMREWELPEPADAVVSFCDCLNYMTEEEDVQAVFRQTFQGLRPGGLYVFDVHAPAQLEAYAANQPFLLDEPDIAYIWTSEWEEKRMEIIHDLTFFVRDEENRQEERFIRFEETHVERAYPQELLAVWLEDAGFEILKVAADFTWNAPQENSERIFFVARRPLDNRL